MAIDPAIPFQPIAIAVLTVSDTRTPDTDKSGDVLAERITQAGHHLIDRAIVSDDIDHIADQIKRWSSGDQVDAIITTGGTGLTGVMSRLRR